MKKIQLILVGIVLLVAYGCNSNIYSEQLKKERKLIESYIARHGLIIVDTLPADDQWTKISIIVYLKVIIVISIWLR